MSGALRCPIGPNCSDGRCGVPCRLDDQSDVVVTANQPLGDEDRLRPDVDPFRRSGVNRHRANADARALWPPLVIIGNSRSGSGDENPSGNAR